jgi:hypothetical protein
VLEVPAVKPLPLLAEAAPLCRAGGHTCAGCCYGAAVSRPELEQQLARQTALFDRLLGDQLGDWLMWRRYELAARGWVGLFWAVLLLTPLLGKILRPSLRRRSVCSFLGYEDSARSRVGCLLHPSRHGAGDVRRRAAFPLWRGFGCGAADYLCPAGHRFARADWRAVKRFLDESEGLDWFDYGGKAQLFPGRAHEQAPRTRRAQRGSTSIP